MSRLANGLDLSKPRLPRASAGAIFADQRRRGLLAKVHLARKELGLIEDDYRQILLDETGKASAGDCSEAELIRVVERFKGRGWKGAAPAGKPSRPRPADHPSAKKARALWISLHQLGVVGNPSETALEAFAKRQLRCDRLQWANQAQSYKLIEALKAMAERAGWSQDTAGIAPASIVPVLRARLCERILARLVELDWAPAGWTLAQAAERLCGIEVETATPTFWSSATLDQVAGGLGNVLRRALQAAGNPTNEGESE